MPSNEKILKIVLRLEDQATKELNQAAASIDKLKGGLTSLGTQMTAAFTVPIVAAGVAAVKMASDLDKAMRNIQSITKQTDESLAGLSQTFVDMSTDMSKTTDSAENLAKAYYQIISSGVDAADALSVLEVATKAASAGLTETSVAAEAIVGTLNAYGLSADDAGRVSDILFETVNRGVGSFEELAASMGNVTGLANQLGVPIEEVAAAMATMSKQGINFAEASVAINQAMTSLINPTAEGQKIIEEMGYASGEAMVEALGFAGSLQAIAEHTGGSATEMQKLFGNVRGLRAALALTGDGAQMFSEDLLAMATAAGATDAAFAEQMKSFDAQWKNFQNTLNAMLIEIGQVLLPILSGFMQNVLIPMIQAFRSLPEPVQQFVIGLLAILAAIGPILLIAGQLIGAFQAIMTIAPFVATAFTLMSGPLLPIVALVAFVIAALWLLATNWEQIGTTIMQVATLVDKAFGSIFSKARDTAIQIAQLLATAWQQMTSQAGTSLSQLGQIIVQRLSTLGSQMMILGKAIIDGLINGMKSKAVELVAYIFGLSKEMVAAIKQALGISSPSKVMMEMGKNTALGFQQGVQSAGGMAMDAPSIGGRSVTSRGGGMALAGAGGSGGSGGRNVIQNYYIQAAPGTTDEQVRDIGKKLGKLTKKKSGGLLGNGR
jgi:TP901 family phage tail tape measure protein